VVRFGRPADGLTVAPQHSHKRWEHHRDHHHERHAEKRRLGGGAKSVRASASTPLTTKGSAETPQSVCSEARSEHHFRSDGVWVMPTSRPSGPSSRVTTWPQGSFRVATSSL